MLRPSPRRLQLSPQNSTESKDWRLDGEPEHGSYAVHRLVLPSNRAATCNNRRGDAKLPVKRRKNGGRRIQKVHGAAPCAPSFTKGIKKNTGCCSCASPLTVGRVIPVARAGGVEPGPVLLHDDARDDVFERLVEARQPLQTHLHHARSPLTNLAKEGGKKWSITVFVRRVEKGRIHDEYDEQTSPTFAAHGVRARYAPTLSSHKDRQRGACVFLFFVQAMRRNVRRRNQEKDGGI